MTLTLHQFKTDWQHFRGAIIALWISFAAQLPLSGSSIEPQSLASLQSFLLFIQFVSTAFIVARLIQSDSLVGTSAQWLTRPLRRPQLLWSKTVFILVCIVLPRMLPPLIVGIRHHYSLGQVLTSVASCFLVVVAIVSVVAAGAALTPNLARFTLAAGVGFGAFFLCVAGLELFLYGHSPHVYMESRFVAVWFFASLGGVFTWMWQARPNGTRAGWVVLGSLCLVLPWLSYSWPWDFLRVRHIQPVENLDSIRRFFPAETLWIDRRIFNPNRERAQKGTLALRVPLRPGTWKIGPGKNLVIRSLTRQPQGIQVEIKEVITTPLLGREDFSFGRSIDGPHSQWAYVLYQPDSGEADILAGNQTTQPTFEVLDGETCQTTQLLVPYPLLQERLAGITMPEFLGKAVLCVFKPSNE